ncbi:MAG TPA: oligoendopeptidase F [Candidatus Hydrogenedentes bacterium]|nr:oligoendopeptidase F [Candidatus Hydrogenedentota bacterium]HOV75337.1 oligoendopeptidase F [Candidatus Hydrogenedentota bacterium]HPC15581.1 oligoendopeptidase F [Candidatus Hydrogenedentota bacterium]HRT19401.1 oligoendopeptidase F [Candidatus Hydrogenedentota bacterium]HRT63865.1 oligoendopeptidase F [Candidatus Hydrogenedentota bacterium]
MKHLPKRHEVAVNDTWDLSPLFKSDEAWMRAYRKLERQIPRLAGFKGTLGRSARCLLACLEFQTRFEREAERLGEYAGLKAAEDVGNSRYQGLVARYMHLATNANEQASYIAPEIQAIPAGRMREFLKDKCLAPYRFQLKKLLRYKPHILSHAEERLLAMQGEVIEALPRIFNQLNDADLSFGACEDDRGKKVPLTQGSFRSFLESHRRSIRKKAFDQFYAEYDAHKNTLAAALNASVLQDVYQARVRHFPSAREAALFADNVPIAVYDNLIETVRAHLDIVHRYLAIRKKALRLKSLHVYDTYVPLVQTVTRRTPYEKAARTVCEALSPLGKEYVRPLEEGLLKKRWVDRYENAGKQSGAFSSGSYDGLPYILLNYRDDVLDHVFTLAHEAGHSMHSYLSARSQSFQDYRYSIFVAEVASTFNEQLLNAHLLEQAKDRETRAYLVNREIDEIRGTLIRQTMFAEFERNIHAVVENGEPLTLERFRAEYRSLLDAYFGPEVVIDDALSLECFRIPHFYSAFYVYKYATGLSAAIALSRAVLQGGEAERKRYLAFLQSGGSRFPLDQLRHAGVDLSRPRPVTDAMEHFRALVNELETLV